jgi:hypothetical protein
MSYREMTALNLSQAKTSELYISCLGYRWLGSLSLEIHCIFVLGMECASDHEDRPVSRLGEIDNGSNVYV